MRLHLQSWQEVETYLQNNTGIIIPIGSTEQHGPNGLLGTDAICPEVIAERAGADAGILVAPTFNVGCAQHHLGFPGTITLKPSTMIAAICDWVSSLERHGFRHFYFLNGHGGNVATIDAAFSEIYARRSFNRNADGPGLRLTCKNWWQFKPVFDLCNQMYPTGHGSHATPSEVSVTYFAYPEAVKAIKMSPQIALSGPIRDARDYRERFPDGRIGSDPSQANIDDGRKLVELAAEHVARSYREFVNAD